MSATAGKKRERSESDIGVDTELSTSASSSSISTCMAILERRARPLNSFPIKFGSKLGPVVYWMSRDQRFDDNWAVLYAQAQARKIGDGNGIPGIHIVFNLAEPLFPGANHRSIDFMLRGLREVQAQAHAKNIPLTLLRGDAPSTVSAFCADHHASMLVTDFSPLRIGQIWRTSVAKALEPLKIPYHEVDAHNIVPAWVVSDKKEYGARTIRPKCHKHMNDFLVDFPPVTAQRAPNTSEKLPQAIDPDALMAAESMPTLDRSVRPVEWAVPGPAAGIDQLYNFLQKRLKSYDVDRNLPFKPQAVSGLSPWLHFGSLAAQRCVLEARGSDHRSHSSSFVEELFVRRELADNFCLHTPDYDRISCAYPWAKESLRLHAKDKREYIYSLEALETGATHDAMWNAAQLEMISRGKMHGYMRMYWCKKILEWTVSPDQAMEYAIFLNDKWSLDGRDPNGYVGISWSIAGTHDQGWSERAVFGKIRYMNHGGLLRKFKKEGMDSYISFSRGEYKKYESGATATASASANAIHQADIESFSSPRGDGKSSGTRGKLNNDSIYRGDI